MLLKKYVVAIGLIVVLIASIGIFSNKQPTANVISSSSNIGLDSGFTAPSFNLVDIDSKETSRDGLKGKPLMIFFTTTWCTPCQVGARNLAKYDLETGDKAFNVLIVFVDPQETDGQLRSWEQSFGRKDWFIAKDNGMSSDYEVQYLDTKYVLDKNSVIKWKNLQPLSYETAKQVMGSLI